MPKKSESIYRDACRRFHRALATYLALFAWVKGADFVAVDRLTIEKIFNLQRITSERAAWLEEDMKDVFSDVHFNLALNSNGNDMFDILYLFRHEFSVSDITQCKDNPDELCQEGTEFRGVKFRAGSKNSEEFEIKMLSGLNLLCAGLISAADLFEK